MSHDILISQNVTDFFFSIINVTILQMVARLTVYSKTVQELVKRNKKNMFGWQRFMM